MYLIIYIRREGRERGEGGGGLRRWRYDVSWWIDDGDI